MREHALGSSIVLHLMFSNIINSSVIKLNPIKTTMLTLNLILYQGQCRHSSSKNPYKGKKHILCVRMLPLHY